MALNITKSSESGFPDVYEADALDLQLKIKAVYEYGGPFSLNLTIAPTPVQGSAASTVTTTLISFTSTLDGTNVVQNGGNSFTLSGSAVNVFNDAYYQFIMPDKTLKILKADTTEEYLSLIRWEPPSVKMLTATHSITYLVTPIGVSEDLPYTTTSTFTQDVFWQWRIAIAQFRTVLAKGTI